jgi:hypothetical protein
LCVTPALFSMKIHFLQVLQINVGRGQIFEDEVLLNADDCGNARIYLTNTSFTNQKFNKGMKVGRVENVEESNLHPFKVTDTTPLVPKIIFYMKALSYSFDRELVTVDVQILSTGT